MNVDVQPDGMSLLLDGLLYPEDAVFKCFYWYASEFDVSIDRAPDAHLRVNLRWKSAPASAEFVERLVVRIRRDLIDFKTRDIASKETKTVRDLLIAKAFAHGEEFDEHGSRD